MQEEVRGECAEVLGAGMEVAGAEEIGTPPDNRAERKGNPTYQPLNNCG